jgi:hypothetical protein
MLTRAHTMHVVVQWRSKVADGELRNEASADDDLASDAGDEKAGGKRAAIRARSRSIIEWLRTAMPVRRRDTSLRLRSLTPEFIPEQHETYSAELVALLKSRARRRRVWNIALTGGYGSGKSSVLTQVQRKLKRRVVGVSLSSLSDIGVQNEPGHDLNNHIQKEIVKQLLYREKPSRVPGSRFKRISRLPFLRAVLGAAIAGLVLIAALWLTGWGAPFSLPPARENERVDLLAACGAGAFLLVLLIQLFFHNRVRIEKLGTAATSVSLVHEEGTSFFDEYLDEIVYFFEMTKRDVVIIEDLDRFEDPTIYAALRALNTVLNTSRQLRRRPVHFVYAVRDSIFEDLEKNQEFASPADGPDAQPTTPAANPTAQTASDHISIWQADGTRSDAPTQRTKFFELVLPIVPFITHRTARDLLVEMMERVDPAVAREVLRLVSKHVTDMRLLTNMVNEYRVFNTRVLLPEKLKGLTPSGLFAIVAYKNTHLGDFEQIRVGESSLDTLYRRSRTIIDAGLEQVANELALARDQGQPVARTTARAKTLGAATQALIERWLARLGRSATSLEIRLNGVSRPTVELMTASFWEDVIDGGIVIEVFSQSAPAFTLDAAGVRAELGKVVPKNWASARTDSRKIRLDELRAQERSLRSADFGSLGKLASEITIAGAPVSFVDDLKSILRDPLLVELVAAGHIDRNYALYSSEFHGKVSSANAITFVMQHVQAEVPSHTFELSPGDIESVLHEVGPDIYGSVGLYNVHLYNSLLSRSDASLDTNLQLMASGREVDLDFITAYLATGADRNEFTRRLAVYWNGSFTQAGKAGGDGEKLDLALAAFAGGNPDLEYEIPTPVSDLIGDNYLNIVELTDEEPDPSRAVAMLQRLGVRLPSLDGLSPSALSLIRSTRQYVVTGANLRTATSQSDISLDRILTSDMGTFDHALSHLDEYLGVIKSESAASFHDQSEVVDILVAIEVSQPGRAIEVLVQTPSNLRVADLDGVPTNIMGILAEGRRFALSDKNLNVYLTARAMDDALISFLADSSTIEKTNLVDDAVREGLAVKLANTLEIPVSARRDLISSLLAIGAFPIGRLTSREPDLIRELVDSKVLGDNPTNFEGLAGSPEAQEAFIVASLDAPNYFPQLSRTPALLQRLVRNALVSLNIKREILQSTPRGDPFTDASVVNALANWASEAGELVPTSALDPIFASAANTESKLKLLDSVASTLPGSRVSELVRQVALPYADLLHRGAKPVDLPPSPKIEAVLVALRDTQDGTVTKWEASESQIRVWRRHELKE